MPYFDFDDVPDEVREEEFQIRKRRARMNHWCSTCLGHTGPGSPCEPDDEPTVENDEE